MLKSILAFGVAAVFCLLLTHSAQAQVDEQPRLGRVLLVLTNTPQLPNGEPTGLFLSEAAHPYDEFTHAGMQITLASPAGGLAPIDPRSLREVDATSQAFLDTFAAEVDGRAVVLETAALADLDPSAFDVIFFAGGHGAMFDFPDHPEVIRLGDAIYANGGIVAAVCHGPAALVNLSKPDGTPLVEGLSITGFTNEEEQAVDLVEQMPFPLETRLTELGGRWSEAENFQLNVEIDERVVTGQNPASASGTAQIITEMLWDRQTQEMGFPGLRESLSND